jgi:hypothetical protein
LERRGGTANRAALRAVAVPFGRRGAAANTDCARRLYPTGARLTRILILSVGALTALLVLNALWHLTRDFHSAVSEVKYWLEWISLRDRPPTFGQGIYPLTWIGNLVLAFAQATYPLKERAIAPMPLRCKFGRHVYGDSNTPCTARCTGCSKSRGHQLRFVRNINDIEVVETFTGSGGHYRPSGTRTFNRKRGLFQCLRCKEFVKGSFIRD